MSAANRTPLATVADRLDAIEHLHAAILATDPANLTAGEVRWLVAQARAVARPAAVSDAALAELRALRLYHWGKALDASPRRFDKRASRHSVLVHEAAWTHHMRAVQALNSLFPVGDTAERDAAAARGSRANGGVLA